MDKEKFDYYIKTEKNNWEVVIGLEGHAQVISASKLFSGFPLDLIVVSTIFPVSA